MKQELLERLSIAVILVAIAAFAVGYGTKARDNVYTAEMMQAVLVVDNAITFSTADGELFNANGTAEVGKWYAVVLKDHKCTDEITDDEVVRFTETKGRSN